MDTNERLLKLLTASPEQQAEIDRILEDKPKPEIFIGPLLMNMSEAAELLHCSRATIWRCIRAGRLKKVELFTNSYRLRRADVEALARGEKAPQ